MALLQLHNLHTYFFTETGIVKAVNGINFSLERGEILGLVGESGAGKSVTGFSILGLIDPPGRIVEGDIFFNGKNLLQTDASTYRTIRGNQIASIFQDPQTSLDPVMTIGSQIIESLQAHHPHLDKKAAWRRAVEMLEHVGLPAAKKRMHAYPHQLSGGMKQRVVIAMALLNNPLLLIADEPTTALDVTIQAQILYLMQTLVKDFNTSLIFISHDLSVISQICNTVAVMYAGRIVEYGDKSILLSDPKHPYTKGLIASLPTLEKSKKHLTPIPGTMPSLSNLPRGCYFKDRCPLADSQCDHYPEERIVAGRRISCHHI